jgi:acetyl-CoA C-acetyltransferase
MSKVYIVDAVRTAIGSFLGSLQKIPAHDLGSEVIKAIIKKNKVKKDDVSEVILGQVLTAAQGQNPARQAAINAGLPEYIPSFLINKVCGSGLKSVILGAQSILQKDSALVIAGGQENMSAACHAANIREHKMGNVELIDTMVHDGLMDAFNKYHMGITAENVAKKYNISRKEQDVFSCESQIKAATAQKAGKFKDEIIPIEVASQKGMVAFAQDEFIKVDTTTSQLNSLKSAFKKNGTVTAGNSSGINDGAAAILLADHDMVKKYSWKPLAEIVSYAVSGVSPSIMGIGPVDAVKKALLKANWSINDLDIIEANEAFAAQALAVNKLLKWDVKKVNVNGGAIALGHPIGASGARILVTLLHQMKKQNAQKALATLCVGGGMGVAMCVRGINN